MEKSIVYNNRKFTLGTLGRYYFGTVKGKNKSLHRYKYETEVGLIPKGWHIHHKDGNCFNNDIENLVAIEPKAHAKLHPKTPEQLAKWHAAGIKAAPVWHSSEYGIEWHHQHYLNIKEKLHERVKQKCTFCGGEHLTIIKTGNSFCSNKCKSGWRRKNKPDMKLVKCEKCGVEFSTLKYLPNRFCSKECKPAPNPLGYHSRKLNNLAKTKL